MSNDFLPLITFVVISVFTPGPNNISAAAMGVLHGYRATFKYLIGIVIGFFFMLLVSAWASASLLSIFPNLQSTLRYVGAAYILYLAYSTFKASYGFDDQETKPLGFANGLLLQVLNPKLIVFGLTLFSTFLAPITDQALQLVLAALLLTLTAFTAISVWTLFGSAIKTQLRNPRIRLLVNSLLSFLLVYSALDVSGIFK